jgi:hypothetical protein
MFPICSKKNTGKYHDPSISILGKKVFKKLIQLGSAVIGPVNSPFM